MTSHLRHSSGVEADSKLDKSHWNEALRKHDRQVFLSLLAMGLDPESARDVAQAAWTKLYENQETNKIQTIKLPGLAIKQARFLALGELRKQARGEKYLKVISKQTKQGDDVEAHAISKQNLQRALHILSLCSPNARKIFRLLYTPPGQSHREIAQKMGLSLQRVRQIICETRNTMREELEVK